MDLVLAAASRVEIDSFQRAWRRELRNKSISQLTTSVDIELFSPQPDLDRLKKQYSIAGDVLHFVCVGRLAKVKGIDYLIDALDCFNERYRDAVLLLVGEGEEKESLRRYAESKGLSANVRFLGNLQPRKVRDIVNCADLCLVGSTFEGFSCAMVEQIACGKPLVSTDVSGASEIIEHSVNGFIVAARDPGEFALYMHRALELSGAGEKSRNIAVERYSEYVTWNRFLTLLEDSLEKSGGPT
jgi:glycosyltransferase involved in cell wall biosynthesis